MLLAGLIIFALALGVLVFIFKFLRGPAVAM